MARLSFVVFALSLTLGCAPAAPIDVLYGPSRETWETVCDLCPSILLADSRIDCYLSGRIDETERACVEALYWSRADVMVPFVECVAERRAAEERCLVLEAIECDGDGWVACLPESSHCTPPPPDVMAALSDCWGPF